MKNFTRKVVILENLTSPYIHQAIIVLNDYSPANETKVIKDAEKVVSQYLIKNGYANADNTKTYVSERRKEQKSAVKGQVVFCALAAITITAFLLIKLF